MSQKLTPSGLCLDEYDQNTSLSDVFFKRAIGELPEMESSKAAADVMSEYVKDNDSILDVGCGAGHYLRSLKRVIKKPFTYTGVDNYQIFVNKAKEAWKDEPNASFRQGDAFTLPTKDKEFDIVMCNNLLMHLPSLVKPMGELIRSAKRTVVIRTYIGDKSFRVQEVLNKKWWPYTDVEPENEFTDDGEPLSFSYENIYSEDYFKSVILRHAPHAKIKCFKDEAFSAENINASADKEGLVNATRVISGMQVFGYLILPLHFAIIDLQNG